MTYEDWKAESMKDMDLEDFMNNVKKEVEETKKKKNSLKDKEIK